MRNAARLELSTANYTLLGIAKRKRQRRVNRGKMDLKNMTIDELEREYTPLRQQALAVRSYL